MPFARQSRLFSVPRAFALPDSEKKRRVMPERSQGPDMLNDPEAMRKFLNDPDNRAFRTTLERV